VKGEELRIKNEELAIIFSAISLSAAGGEHIAEK